MLTIVQLLKGKYGYAMPQHFYATLFAADVVNLICTHAAHSLQCTDVHVNI